ncbi:MAG TPA: hypothetical protein VLH81_10010, partial [Desulfobacterales bacterium]|nr:hypothetical protein [Desulfobacterales bacterium]
RVLAEKVALGQFGTDDALAAARAMLYESPQTLLGMRPRAEAAAAQRATAARARKPARGAKAPAHPRKAARKPSR